MADRRVISVYSRALYGLARERDMTDTVTRELTAFGRMVRKTPELEALWLRMRLPVGIKSDVLHPVLGTGFSSLTRYFLLTLVRHRRESYLWAVQKAFAELVRRGLGRVGVRVFSPVPLSASQRSGLQTLAERITGAEADVEYRVDPALMGGFILRAGDYMLDASLRGRLERLRSAMAAGSEVTEHGTPG